MQLLIVYVPEPEEPELYSANQGQREPVYVPQAAGFLSIAGSEIGTTLNSQSLSTTSSQRDLSDVQVDPMSGFLSDTETRSLNAASTFVPLADADEAESFSVLSNRVISEFLEYRSDKVTEYPDTPLGIDLFDDSVNIAELFAMALQEDPEMFELLESDFEQNSEELNTSFMKSQGVLASSISLTSGLSIGYLLYIIRGGVIMSSMLSSLPAWRFVDPLPILGNLEGTAEGDRESLQTIIGNTSKN